MSQYPSPYGQPSYYPQYQGYPYQARNPLSPAKRASILMFVLGGLSVLGMLCGFCLMTFASMPESDIPPESREEVQKAFTQIESAYGMPAKIVFIGLTVAATIQSVLLITLGVFVRKGRKWAIITSTVLVTLVLGLTVLSTLVQFARFASNGGVPSLCGPLFSFVLWGLLLTWLIQALKALPQIQAMQEQYQMQYWQYQQQMQSYQQPQQNYGYPTAPQNPPPPQPPQSGDLNGPAT